MTWHIRPFLIDDLQEIYTSLGMRITSGDQFDTMLKEANGPLNKTRFTTMLGSQMTDMDEDQVKRTVLTYSFNTNVLNFAPVA